MGLTLIIYDNVMIIHRWIGVAVVAGISLQVPLLFPGTLALVVTWWLSMPLQNCHSAVLWHTPTTCKPDSLRSLLQCPFRGLP